MQQMLINITPRDPFHVDGPRRHYRIGLWCTLLACVSLVPGLHAQNTVGSVMSQVQRLYAQARTAQAGGKISTAIAKYQQIIKLAPNLSQAYNNLGMLYYQQGAFSEAEAVLRTGLKLDPGLVATSALLGSTQFARGKYGEARPHLEAAVRGNPRDDFARALLARDLVKLKDYDGAVVQLHVLVTHNPKDQDAWYQLGRAQLELSEIALRKVTEINPNSALSQEVAGEIMQDMGNSEGALVAYKKAVDIAPRQPGTHEHLGGEYWVLGKWESARSEFQAELANDPQNCQVRWKMANCLVNMHGSSEEAMKELNDAISQCPDLMQAHVDRARTMLATGKPEAAVADLLMAEKSDPQEPTIHFYLANAYRAQGRTSDAHNEMQIYSRLMDSATEMDSKLGMEAESMIGSAH